MTTKYMSLACMVTSCVTQAFNITTTESLDLWFTAITTMLLSPNETIFVNSAMKILKKFSLTNYVSSLVDEIMNQWPSDNKSAPQEEF